MAKGHEIRSVVYPGDGIPTITKDTGCLRVIPTSYKLPLYKALDGLNQQKANTSMQLFGVAGQEMAWRNSTKKRNN